jgi:hypothetical protein
MGAPEPLFFGRLRPDDADSSPSWLLRRVVSGDGPVDELLGRDGEWRASDMLARTERGELPGTLDRMGPFLAAAIVKNTQRQYRVVRRALARQRAGEFLIRLAVPGTGTVYGKLDDEARAETTAFLTGAPLVTSGPDGTFRTDGMWVWPESIAAHVTATGEPPEDQFFYHLRARGFFFPETVDDGVLDRARALLATAAGDHPDRVRETNVPGQAPPPTRQERLQALGRWHAEWSAKHAGSTPFRPGEHPGEEDYNLHYVDLEASPEAEREYTVRAREIMGLDPETGERVDI